MAFRPNDGYNLSLKGTSVQQSGTVSARPSSARNNSQSKRSITPSRGGGGGGDLFQKIFKNFERFILGSNHEHRINSNISSARQR
jgi:hypothetical protein